MKKLILCFIFTTFLLGLTAQENTGLNVIPKMIDLGATKCIPCKKMAPILDELKTQYKGVFDVEFIDVWQKENSQKAARYNIQSIPTQIFFDKDGKELARHVGFISKEDILDQWKSLGYNFESKANDLVEKSN